MAVQSDGKIVAAGDAGGQTAMGLVQYTTSGALDPSFGSGGKVTNKAGIGIRDIEIQPDGKIIAGGFDSKGNLVLARFLGNGSLDTTFGSKGKVSTSVAGSVAWAIALQPDGKIVAAGQKNSATSTDFAVSRFNANGSLDTTFGNGGAVTTDFVGYGDFARGVVIQPDGKILVAGTSSDKVRFSGTSNLYALARYNANGSLDASFGTAGKVVTNLRNTPFVPPQITFVQTDLKGLGLPSPTAGRVVAVNAAWGGTYRMTLAQYGTDGTLDPTFGAGGVTMFETPGGEGITQALALRPDGKLVVAGRGLRVLTGLMVAQVLPDGALDPPSAERAWFLRPGPTAGRTRSPSRATARSSLLAGDQFRGNVAVPGGPLPG